MIDLEQTLKEVKQAINYAKNRLLTGPQGNLRTKHYRNTVLYFQREDGKSDGKYIGKENVDLIRELEDKAYYKELLDVAQKEECFLEKLKKTLGAMPDYKSVFLNISAEKRHLISPYEPPVEATEDIIRVFNKKKLKEDYKLVTQNGEHVRSKSELILADRFKSAGVPYFYEDPLIMAKQNNKQDVSLASLYWHPDFRVQNVRTGKYYYWEHFGMMDDQGYCASCLEKLEIYAQYGYFPGENLIITTESSKHGLNMAYVDCLIEKYLK